MTDQTNQQANLQDKPSDAQKYKLGTLKVPAAEIAKMTKSQASQRIDEELRKDPNYKPQQNYQPQVEIKIATLEELLEYSDKIRKHITTHDEYQELTEIGQMRTWEVILNNLIKGKITEGISKNNRRR